MKANRTGTILRATACLLMVALLFVFLSAERDLTSSNEPDRQEPVAPRDEPVNLRPLSGDAMAVLFCDLAEYSDGITKPTMIMLAVTDDGGRFTGVTIPPQTRVLVDQLDAEGKSVSVTYATLADAYVRGSASGFGFENLLTSVSRLFGGLPVSGCVALGLRGVEQLVDRLGGISVQYDHFSAVSGGVVGGGEATVRLTGAQIHDYASSSNRDVDTGALARQQEVFMAIYALLRNRDSAFGYEDLLAQTQPWFWSNLPQAEAARLSEAMFAGDPSVEMLVLWGENRIIDNISYRLPDKEAIKDFVLERFYPAAEEAEF